MSREQPKMIVNETYQIETPDVIIRADDVFSDVPEFNKLVIQHHHTVQNSFCCIITVFCCHFDFVAFQNTAWFNLQSACNIAPQVSGPCFQQLPAGVYMVVHK